VSWRKATSGKPADSTEPTHCSACMSSWVSESSSWREKPMLSQMRSISSGSSPVSSAASSIVKMRSRAGKMSSSRP
jgi:hypothetical protein